MQLRRLAPQSRADASRAEGDAHMPRNYCKEAGTKYGRPPKGIDKEPPPFLADRDEEMKAWDARRFLRELVIRQEKEAWKHRQSEWGELAVTGTPLVDLDEINRFLHRLPPVTRITSKEDASHALNLRMILIAVDPYTPEP
jgi:hypothetical protein